MKNTVQPIRMLITGVSGGSIGEQVFKTLRMGHLEYDLVVTNTSRVLMSVAKAEHYEILPPASSSEYLDSLCMLIGKYGIQFVIPGSEPELIGLSQAHDVLSATQAHLLINSEHIITTCVDKLKTFETLSNLGFHVPRTIEISDVNELKALASNFPYIVKPIQGGGSAATFIAQDNEELQFFTRYLMRYGHRPLVQEYIGDAESEYTVGVLHAPDGIHIGTITLRRSILSGLSSRLRVPNQTGRVELGKILAVSSGISQGEILDFAPVRAQAEAIAHALGSVGPLNIQGRWDGNEFIPFEINPRFSGTTPMRAIVGFNEPELLVNWYINHSINPPQHLRYGSFTRGLVEYFVETGSVRKTKNGIQAEHRRSGL